MTHPQALALATQMDDFLHFLPPCAVEVVAHSINRVYAATGNTKLMLSSDEIARRREQARMRIDGLMASPAPVPAAPPMPSNVVAWPVVPRRTPDQTVIQ